jgi:PilZ domain
LKERRQYERKDLSMEVVVILPDGESMTLRTGNTSDGGALIMGDGRALPDVGTEIGITVRNPIAGKKAPVHKARVVRKTDEGIGIELLIPGSVSPPKE